MKKFVLSGICLLFLLPCRDVLAETMYVREVDITMRMGPGNHRGIIEMLSPGREVEVLEHGEGWTNVLLQNGKEGWVLSRYLTYQKPAKCDSEAIKQEHEAISERMASLVEENEKLKEENKRLGSESSDTEETFDELSKAYEELKKESADFLKFKKAYQKMSSELARKKRENEQLKKMMAKTNRNNTPKWFLSQAAMYGFFCGAGVLLFGFIIGFVIAKRQSRRSLF